MTTGDTPALVRNQDGSTRATLLELLFDVVFVAALAITSSLIAEHDSWPGITSVVLMLTAIWWTWSVTTTTTEFYDPQQRPIQAILMVAMIGSVGMAAALPYEYGFIFALSYVGTHVTRGIILITALSRLRHMRARARALRFLFWFLVSGVFWIGGALSGTAKWQLWTLAMAIDLAAGALRYPTPRLGRVPVEQYKRTTEHLGERYQQFLILALGDIILMPVLQVSRTGFDRLRAGALLCAFATMLLLWQIYVFRAGQLLEDSLSERRPGRVAPYTHLVTLIGVIGTASAFHVIIEHPEGRTPVRLLMLIIGGPLLFVLGRVVFAVIVARHVPWWRASWQLLPLLTLPWAGGWPPVLVSVVVILALVGHVVIPPGQRETMPGVGVPRIGD
ncbi:low temperature requirement protein A [Micromonospora sp. NPDC000316]|uniref:low temperature requirement protein A n=1 Tax=Micromonospora sp. NPDC000316 TaxID=3364216 RepID=UPI0036747B0C